MILLFLSRMKKIFFLFFVSYSLLVSAQDLSIVDARLFYRYSQVQIEAMSNSNPSQIEYLNFYVNNSYYFQDIDYLPEEKKDDYPNIFDFFILPTDYSISKDDFNILMFDVPFFQNKETTYRFDEQTVLVLRRKSELNRMFNQLNVQ